ncbi:MAG: phosphatase PAP2 family protein [Elusimicrobia bacterium]|nr:phosphatase PAP2 family protein [Elusimicrobiota bacterium]
MLEFLSSIDRFLFDKINHAWTHPWLDAFFPWLTDLNKNKVFLFGALPVVLSWWVYRRRGPAVKVLLAMTLAAGLCDAVAYRFIKPAVARSRPSIISSTVRTSRHSGYSFPSNHAANMFAGATVLAMAVPSVRVPAFAAAGLVAYSRVYVGVHYPFDVLAGALLGLLGGGLVGAGLQRFGGGGGGSAPSRKKRAR